MAKLSFHKQGRNNQKNKKMKTGKKQQVHLYKTKKKRWENENAEISRLNELCTQFDGSSVQIFTDFPLSKLTLKGLKDSGYLKPTEIQKESIGLALKQLDILGAAKTGSGKTLAFLIPVLEHLYKQKWTRLDGLGALIITPTRELAYQIFEVLRKIGRYHDFSAGLIIGGKDLKFERTRMDKCNIIICTPGRLLQHMDENPLFDCNQLQVLVLDEADRILDLGFQETMNAIIQNLPKARQTLLFSATQTKSVKDLARLSLRDPMYVSVHEHSKHSTPESLMQSYIVCELDEKINLLWSFIKHHLKQKILVFMSSCKQVKFLFEAFCRMRPGTSLLALYGSMHQKKRMQVYDDFCEKRSAILLATDIAARGLDFPAVHWVIQLDCPEDANTYIHRAGRTARYEKGGEALLILLPSEEEAMMTHLDEKKIPITKIKVNPSKQHSIQRKMEAMLARDVTLKESAQRAFKAYIKSVFLMKDKKVFNVKKLNTDSFARSLGLAIAPRIRFLEKAEKQQVALKESKESFIDSIKEKLKSKEDKGSSASEEEDNEEEEKDNIPEMPKEDSSKQPYLFHNFNEEEDNDSDDLLTVKRRIMPEPIEHEEELMPEAPLVNKNLKPITKAAVAKRLLKKKIKPNVHKVFNDEGEEMLTSLPKEQVSEAAKSLSAENELGGIDIEKAKTIMREEDRIDKQLFRERIKALHREKRLKEKQARREMAESKRKNKKETKREKEEEEDEDSESESGGYDIDLLPDPDKIYGPKQDESEGNSSSEEGSSKSSDSDEDSSEEEITSQKRKQRFKSPAIKRQKKESKPLDTGLSLQDDEELALQLLNAS